MSTRHRNRPDRFIDHADRSERSAEHRRNRHQVRQRLDRLDGDSVYDVIDSAGVRQVDRHIDGRERDPADGPGRRRVRHWKLKAWKRRTARRQARAAQLEALYGSDD